MLIREDRRHLNTESDSEVLLNVFASELQRVGTPRVTPADIFAAVSAVYRRCRGGYAVVAMVIGHGMLGFRDPNGIRPLVLGQRRTPRGTEYMLASENVALDMLSFELVRDVAPGEAVFIDEHGRLHSQQCVATVRHTPCIFEYVYFARPDSIIDNISVYRARMRMGEKLAAKILREHPNHDIDVIIPIPDTSRTSALQMAQILGIKYREGFTKNRYIGRTFIMPGQEQRERSGAAQAQRHRAGVSRQERAAGRRLDRARHHLGADHRAGARGRRQEGLFRLGRAAGAVSERLRHRHAGHQRTGGRRPQRRGGRASSSVPTGWSTRISRIWSTACRHDNAKIEEFDTSCFSGEYVTGDVTFEYLDRLQRARSDEAKVRRRMAARRTQGRRRALTARRRSVSRMRLLLVEEDPKVRSLLRHHLSCRWPEVQISAHPPLQRGPLPR